MSASELRNQGNTLYAARKYDDAIACYTKAIIKNPNTALFFTNRALCHLKLRQWDKALQDCQRALDIDRSWVKGHFFMGQAFVEQAMYDEAITSLKRAHDLAKEQKLNFGDDITSALRVAKKQRWSMIEEKRIQQEIALQTYINRLIKEDKERDDNLLIFWVTMTYYCLKQIFFYTDNNRAMAHCSNRDRFNKRDVPDYLCGKISFEIMRDPVITPSGITYDRKDIIEHLQRVGHFDPVTRTDLTQEQLISNFSLKEVIDSYLEENPWAEDF
ncbi:hypothetical protein EGW08_001232 [Elysia chlorotica]|uniref:E3 ubiquitin-protein ligase CHIP n=1 Tax=Elysia chlorotica TaxID=188477 RepID=A0A3S1BLA9_ELYCH|nr:hypothetical protein EGW08_001232 [Elysia chlorotica]